MLFGILLSWVWLLSSSSFMWSFFVWVFTLCFSGTIWTTMLHSSESPRKETIPAWINHALFIPKVPHGHSDPPRLSSLENYRSGYFCARADNLTEITDFHLSKVKHICFANKHPTRTLLFIYEVHTFTSDVWMALLSWFELHLKSAALCPGLVAALC